MEYSRLITRIFFYNIYRERARTWVKDIHKDKRKENKKKRREIDG
jgi:hypothetical protein